ncbi:hypothetical protein ACA910_005908 [Epithemia clementina (nom. ined.)]
MPYTHNTLDADLSFFASATGYRNIRTDNDHKFQAFQSFAQNNRKARTPFSDPFVIQFVCHPNFEPDRKEIAYYTYNPDTDDFDSSETLPSDFRRANSFQNYKSSGGHPKGLFFELNLYTHEGQSNHHTSRVKGSTFSRDNSNDQEQGSTKGPHWLE